MVRFQFPIKLKPHHSFVYTLYFSYCAAAYPRGNIAVHKVTFRLNVQILPVVSESPPHAVNRYKEEHLHISNRDSKANQLTAWQCNCLQFLSPPCKLVTGEHCSCRLSLLNELPRSWKEWFMTKEDAHLDPEGFLTTPSADKSSALTCRVATGCRQQHWRCNQHGVRRIGGVDGKAQVYKLWLVPWCKVN
jgi:hypothetical protein